ncbi:hypothetical protein VP01_4871g1, partial [Puccinia sorghi]
ENQIRNSFKASEKGNEEQKEEGSKLTIHCPWKTQSRSESRHQPLLVTSPGIKTCQLRNQINCKLPSTTQLMEVEASSWPIVLNSGATHHLIKNPETFFETAEANIKISTGGHKLPSSHFELINPQSSCYQSSSESPNWHTRLGHSNQIYQELMVPASESNNGSISKTFKFKTLSFTGRFKSNSKKIAHLKELHIMFPRNTRILFQLNLLIQFGGSFFWSLKIVYLIPHHLESYFQLIYIDYSFFFSTTSSMSQKLKTLTCSTLEKSKTLDLIADNFPKGNIKKKNFIQVVLAHFKKQYNMNKSHQMQMFVNLNDRPFHLQTQCYDLVTPLQDPPGVSPTRGLSSASAPLYIP